MIDVPAGAGRLGLDPRVGSLVDANHELDRTVRTVLEFGDRQVARLDEQIGAYADAVVRHGRSGSFGHRTEMAALAAAAGSTASDVTDFLQVRWNSLQHHGPDLVRFAERLARTEPSLAGQLAEPLAQARRGVENVTRRREEDLEKLRLASYAAHDLKRRPPSGSLASFVGMATTSVGTIAHLGRAGQRTTGPGGDALLAALGHVDPV